MLDDFEIKRLILLTADRDAAAFRTLYEKTAPTLLGVSLRITRRRELAEDVLHDAFVKVWNQAKTFNPMAVQPVAWLTAIVRNRSLDVVTAADHARVDSYDAHDDDDDDSTKLDRLLDWRDERDAGDAMDQARSSQLLKECFDELKAGERQAIALAYHHGMSHHELAEHMKRPLGTVKSWVKRGLESLRACMESCAAVIR